MIPYERPLLQAHTPERKAQSLSLRVTGSGRQVSCEARSVIVFEKDILGHRFMRTCRSQEW